MRTHSRDPSPILSSAAGTPSRATANYESRAKNQCKQVRSEDIALMRKSIYLVGYRSLSLFYMSYYTLY